MKKFTLLLFCFFCLAETKAQTAQWEWAKCSADHDWDEGTAVSADPMNGNVFAGGVFLGDTVIFGNTILHDSVPGSGGMFIVKYDSAGNLLWARGASDLSWIGFSPVAIAADGLGNVYITGHFSGGSLHFLNTSTTITGTSFFIAKYDSSGNLLWAKGATGYPAGYSITCDRAGNAYVTGNFNGLATFGNVTLTATLLNIEVFVVKYDPSGNVVWARNSNGIPSHAIYGQPAYGLSISTNYAGNGDNLYVAGTFSYGSISFGSSVLTNTDTSGMIRDVFIVAYDLSGNVIWARNAQGDDRYYYVAVAADNNGSAYITGGFDRPAIIFGNDTLLNVDTSGQFTDAFIARYDAAGNQKWVKAVHGPWNEAGCSISADLWGNIYVAIDGGQDSLYTNNFVIYAPVPSDDPLFILLFDSTGNIICSKAIASGGDDYAGISSDPFGNAYVSGDLDLHNGLIFGPDTLRSVSYDEADFTAKFTCGIQHCSVILSPSSWATTCGQTNGSASVSVTGGSGLFTYNWSNGATTANIINAAQGTYTVTVSSSGGCRATASAVVDSSSSLTLSAFGTRAGCINSGAASATVTSGTGPFTYLWSNGSTTSSIGSLFAGNYTITVTGALSCSASASVTVVSTGIGVTLSASATSTNCSSDSGSVSVTTLSGSSPFTYAWSNGATTATVFNLPGGTYTVTVTSHDGCTATASAVVYSSGRDTVIITAHGDTLIASAAATYQWYKNNTPVQGATSSVYVATTDGNYFVRAINDSGCVAVSDTRVIKTSVGIEQLDSDKGILVYPNPLSTGSWHIDVSNEWIGSTCEVYDATGRLIYHTEIKSTQTEIELNIAQGIYLMRANSMQRKYMVRLIKL